MATLADQNRKRRTTPVLDPLNRDSWSIEIGDPAHAVRPELARVR